MRLNKKGVALLQVLIVVAVLASMVAMILRVVLSRSATARQTTQTVTAQMLIENCQGEVAYLWAIKKPEVYARDLSRCVMYCDKETVAECAAEPGTYRRHACQQQAVYPVNMNTWSEFRVIAQFAGEPDGGRCQLTYTLERVSD